MADLVMAASVPLVPARIVDRRMLYLQAGQLWATSEPSVITTIVGSCIAVCLWDARLRIGGMNHYMLPFQTPKQLASPRFGTVAWEGLLTRVMQLGSHRRDLRAGIFGGACVMETFRNRADHVGTRNVELADQLLAQSGIAVVQREVAGQRGRKLIFETDTGHVTVRAL